MKESTLKLLGALPSLDQAVEELVHCVGQKLHSGEYGAAELSVHVKEHRISDYRIASHKDTRIVKKNL